MEKKRAATGNMSSVEDQDKHVSKRHCIEAEQQFELEFGFTATQSLVTLPLWTDVKSSELPSRSASAVAACSLHLWCKQSAHQSLSLKCFGSDDEDTEDTATSSCSSDSSSHVDGAPTATATEDEGDSLQPSTKCPTAAAFSGFGQRACVTPDLSGFEQWDIIETLLALGQS